MIRSTYLGINDKRLCSLQNYMNRPGAFVECRIAYTFVIGGGESDKAIEHIMEDEHDGNIALSVKDVKGADPTEMDVVYLNIRENMENGKTVTWLRYGAMIANQYAGINYIAKVDDDSLFSMDHYFAFVEKNLPPVPFNFNIYGGESVANHFHDSLYMMGQFFFMATNLADHISNALTAKDREELSLYVYHKRHIEDMELGVFVDSHPDPIKFVALQKRKFWIHPIKSNGKWMHYWKNEMQKLPETFPTLNIQRLCEMRDDELNFLADPANEINKNERQAYHIQLIKHKKFDHSITIMSKKERRQYLMQSSSKQ